MTTPLPDSVPEPVMIECRANSRLALYRLEGPASSYPPVVMTHGTFSNAAICLRLALFLREAGFDCWIYEWGNHGLGSDGDWQADAEDYGCFTVPAILKEVRLATGWPTCIWVAHSGGGFLPLMYLARNPDKHHEIQALVAVGSQTTGAGRTLNGKLMIIGAATVLKVLGRIPGPLLGLGPEDEGRGFMMQWCRWNWAGQWLGKDGFNYLHAMATIDIPMLSIAGGHDRIAPAAGCRILLNAVHSENKRFVFCSKTNGFAEDYNHTRLIASSNSKKEIWPLILNFVGDYGMLPNLQDPKQPSLGRL